LNSWTVPTEVVTINGVRVTLFADEGVQRVTGFWHPVQFSKSGSRITGFLPADGPASGECTAVRTTTSAVWSAERYQLGGSPSNLGLVRGERDALELVREEPGRQAERGRYSATRCAVKSRGRAGREARASCLMNSSGWDRPPGAAVRVTRCAGPERSERAACRPFLAVRNVPTAARRAKRAPWCGRHAHV
jgi:hypothetical protein